ncbi:MAG: flippase [Agathobacter sp.]|nr:flippase [Agathobacter sp.]
MKTLTKNYFYNLMYQVLSLIIPLITAPYISRVLAADTIGQYSFAQSIVSYFVLFASIGTGMYGQRYIAELTAHHGNTRKAFWEITILRGTGIGLAILLYCGTILRYTDSRLIYAVAGIEILAALFDISWFYQGTEQFQKLSVFNGFCRIIATVCIFVFVRAKDDLVIYMACNGLAILASNLIQCIEVHRYMSGDAPRSEIHPFRHILPSLRLFVAQLAIQLYTVLDKTMIGLITKSNYENGYYEQCQKIIRMLEAIITSLGTVMASRITILWHGDQDKNKEQIHNLLLFSFRVVFAIGLPIMMGVILIADRIVPIYYGPGYEPVCNMLKWLSVIVPTIGVSNVIGYQLLIPSKRERLMTISVVCGSIVNIITNLILIPRFGAMGAIYASVLSEIIVSSVQLFMVRKELHFRPILRIFFHYFGYSVVMLLIGGLLLHLLGDGVLALLIAIIACVLVYALCLIIMHDPILSFIFSKEDSYAK